jgi:hypothetical protein
MKYLINTLYVFEWIAFLASLVFFKQLKKQNLVLIPVLLFVIVFSEAIGILISIHALKIVSSNEWFNVMIPVQFLCLFLLFYRQTNFRYWRRSIILFSVIIIIVAIVYMLLPGQQKLNVLNYTLGVIFLSAVCLHYLYECMNSESIIGIYTNSLFYLAIGTLLYYLGTLPLYSMWHYLYLNYRNIFNPYYCINYILNIMMYGFITFGIVWANRK